MTPPPPRLPRPPRRLLRAAFLLAAVAALLLSDLSVRAQSSAGLSDRRLRRDEHRERLKELVEKERKRLEEAEEKRKIEEVRQEAERRGIKLDEQGKLVAPPKKPDEATAVQMTRIDAGPPLVLVMKPYSQVAQVGERFVTEIAVYSDLSREYRGIRLRIDFPPEVVQPVQIFDFPLEGWLDPANPPASMLGDRSVTYTADFATTVSSVQEKPLIYVGWVAIGPTVASTLRFHGGDSEEQCAILAGENNLLASGQTVSNACINGELIVHEPEDVRDPGLRIVRDDLPAAAAPQTVNAPSVALAIVPPAQPPAVGEDFVVSVHLANPDEARIDELHLAIGFDPGKVEILDWDYKNWIRRGVNVFDGHAHGRYPWNVHLQNEVDNRRGRIAYQMGLTRPAALPSGSVVRIHCRALTSDAFETLTLFPHKATPLWSTDVLFGRTSLLERPGQAPSDSLRLTDVSGVVRDAASAPSRP